MCSNSRPRWQYQWTVWLCVGIHIIDSLYTILTGWWKIISVGQVEKNRNISNCLDLEFRRNNLLLCLIRFEDALSEAPSILFALLMQIKLTSLLVAWEFKFKPSDINNDFMKHKIITCCAPVCSMRVGMLFKLHLIDLMKIESYLSKTTSYTFALDYHLQYWNLRKNRKF